MDSEKLVESTERLTKELGIDDSQAKDLINDAVIIVLDYTNRDDMLDAMWLYVRQLATIAYNRQGTEGELSRSEGGVSQSFIDGIPGNIKSSLNRYRLGRMRGFYASKSK